MEIPKKPNECAFHVETNGAEPVCMESRVVSQLQDFIRDTKNINVSGEKDVIKTLKQIYDCPTEACLLKRDEVVQTLGSSEAEAQLKERFKVEGPHKKDVWLSNFNIDGVLGQIAIKYKDQGFKHVPFQMRDFQEINSELATIDFVAEYNNGVRCFGVVFNDDKSSGGGTHWTAMFGDFTREPFAIEHFNSSGAGPKNEMREWMHKTKHRLEKGLDKKVIVKEISKIEHQLENSACGVYSLYYIMSRLEGVPAEVFNKTRIPDSVMNGFRLHLFRKKE